MTGDEAGDIDPMIDASFYSQGFPVLKNSRQSISLHVPRLSLRAFMILGHSWPSKADRQWARAPFAFVVLGISGNFSCCAGQVLDTSQGWPLSMDRFIPTVS